MNPLINWGCLAVIIAGYLIGLYFQNRSIGHLNTRISDLRAHMDKRLDDVADGLRCKMRTLGAELTNLIERNHREVMTSARGIVTR